MWILVFQKSNETFVYTFLSNLDLSKATGLDFIGPRLLKISSAHITNSVTYIVNKSITSSTFPKSWKQAKVNPLYKSGAKDEVNNYRPISILPTLSKLIEKWIQRHLMEYLNSFNLLHQTQSGFRAGHSTESALIVLIDHFLQAINQGKLVGCILVDFRKAFDLVDHKILLEKLKMYKCKRAVRKMVSVLFRTKKSDCINKWGEIWRPVYTVWCAPRFNPGPCTLPIIYKRFAINVVRNCKGYRLICWRHFHIYSVWKIWATK